MTANRGSFVHSPNDHITKSLFERCSSTFRFPHSAEKTMLYASEALIAVFFCHWVKCCLSLCSPNCMWFPCSHMWVPIAHGFPITNMGVVSIGLLHAWRGARVGQRKKNAWIFGSLGFDVDHLRGKQSLWQILWALGLIIYPQLIWDSLAHPSKQLQFGTSVVECFEGVLATWNRHYPLKRVNSLFIKVLCLVGLPTLSFFTILASVAQILEKFWRMVRALQN
ncbi:hypothetical protein ACSBR2_018949 [Camellia fascicularis]